MVLLRVFTVIVAPNKTLWMNIDTAAEVDAGDGDGIVRQAGRERESRADQREAAVGDVEC